LRRILRQSAILVLCFAPPLSAQLAPVGAPKGTLRFTIGGTFESGDRRLFEGRGEDFLADFGSPALGSDRFAFLRAADSVIGQVIGQPSYKINLGALRANGLLTVGTGTIGAALGVTRKLTLFANVPFVTIQVKARLREDSSTADAGFNPAHPTLGTAADQTAANTFFSNFQAALDNLDARISSGAYAGNPALLNLATEIAQRGAQIRSGLASITNASSASPFLPTASSTTGIAVANVIRALQDTLANRLGVSSPFTDAPVLAASRLGQGDVTGFVSNPAGPIDAMPLVGAKLSRMGDMDVGAVYTLVDRFDRIGHRPGGFRLAAQGLLRLPTGLRDNPDNLLQLGTGNGRYELGASGTADFGSGLWGARLNGGYLARPALRRREPVDQRAIQGRRRGAIRRAAVSPAGTEPGDSRHRGLLARGGRKCDLLPRGRRHSRGARGPAGRAVEAECPRHRRRSDLRWAGRVGVPAGTPLRLPDRCLVELQQCDLRHRRAGAAGLDHESRDPLVSATVEMIVT